MMITSYHNHTTWSDGSASLAALIAGARLAGVDELGISDHYVLHPAVSIPWPMPLERLADYVAELAAARAATTEVALRIGLEADYFPETVDELARRLAPCSFDYLIGSVHFVNDFPVDEAAGLWERLDDAARNDSWRQYWHVSAGWRRAVFSISSATWTCRRNSDSCRRSICRRKCPPH